MFFIRICPEEIVTDYQVSESLPQQCFNYKIFILENM